MSDEEKKGGAHSDVPSFIKEFEKQQKLVEKMKPHFEAQKELEKKFKPFLERQKRLAEKFKPYVEAQKKLEAQLKPLMGDFNRMNRLGKIDLPSDIGLFPPPPNLNLASEFKKRIEDRIMNFLNNLDPDKEVGIVFINFGHSHTIHLEEVRFSNPSLITFKGKDEVGSPVEVIQHVTQIKIMLKQIPIDDSTKKRRTIGFFIEGVQEKSSD